MFDTLLIYLPLVSLAGWLAMFAIKHKSLFAGDIAGLVYHLALIPLVAHLPGGPAVRFAGYLWLYTDALVDVVSINKIGHDTAWALRMGAHLFAAVWLCGTSMEMGGASLWIGVPLGVGLAIHAIFLADAPNNKKLLGVFVVPLMTAWLLALQLTLLREGLSSTPID